MKKIATIFLMTVLLLTACTNSEPLESSDTTSSSTSSVDSENSSTNSIENSSSSENSTTESTSINSNEVSDSNHEMSVEELIDSFALDSFTAPDGNTVNKSEAIYVYYDEDFEVASSIGFDFSYIRYAKPIFHNTLDEPDLVNWDTIEFKVKPFSQIENPNYFKVKAGDKLKNGLTVKSAKYWIDINGNSSQSRIELIGELTLEGVLYRAPEDDYGIGTDDLIFFADSTTYDSIPITPDDMTDITVGWVDTESEFAVISDETRIWLGNYNDISVDLSGIIDRGEYVKAKIAIKDINLKFYVGPGRSISATLVSVD